MAYPFKLPDLPYAPESLEPHIDARTMEIHHGKHHQAYTNNLNGALEKHPDLQGRSAEDLVQGVDSLPQEIRTVVRNNGGGYVNHNLFWEIMSPNGGGEPGGDLGDAIRSKFGGFQEFRQAVTKAATGQFGSGWGWLVVKGGELEVYATANQDSPLMKGHSPLLGVDVWEHAYYLKYQNRRPDYLEAWWNLVNWDAVAKRYASAR
jgi:superoxide dismutase, Fe-Mn family